MRNFVIGTGLEIESVTELNDEIIAVIGLDHETFQSGFLDSNFEAFTGFTENTNGVLEPVFEPVTLTFNGY